jgi:hypothetical protein
MIQIVYASAACAPFSANALRVLLEQARARNTTYNVSGLLLYHQSSFLQILEGPRDSVEHIYHSIERDPRHDRTKVLLRKTLAQREFAEWKMGFVDTASWGLMPRGMLDYSRLNCEGVGSEVASGVPSQARKYVRFFFDGLCRQA